MGMETGLLENGSGIAGDRRGTGAEMGMGTHQTGDAGSDARENPKL